MLLEAPPGLVGCASVIFVEGMNVQNESFEIEQLQDPQKFITEEVVVNGEEAEVGALVKETGFEAADVVEGRIFLHRSHCEQMKFLRACERSQKVLAVDGEMFAGTHIEMSHCRIPASQETLDGLNEATVEKILRRILPGQNKLTLTGSQGQRN